MIKGNVNSIKCENHKLSNKKRRKNYILGSFLGGIVLCIIILLTQRQDIFQKENVRKTVAQVNTTIEKDAMAQEKGQSIKQEEKKSEIAIMEKQNKEAQKTQSVPKEKNGDGETQKQEVAQEKRAVARKIIVLDPGHANKTDLSKEPNAPGSSVMKVKEPGGAQGVYTKTPEYEVNMAVALMLRDLLQAKGYTVIMTKTKHETLLGNVARAEIGNKAKADLVVRIHADSSENTSVRGASMLVPGNAPYTQKIYEESKEYGQVILDTLIEEVGMKNRGIVERRDITGFNWSTVPVILVEMGFQSNPEEDQLLSSISYQRKLANALGKGIELAMKKK